MKFGQEWKRVTQSMPPELAKRCLNYKRWKKRVTFYSDAFLRDIRKEAKRIDHFVKQQWAKLYAHTHKQNKEIPLSPALLWECAITPFSISASNPFAAALTPQDLYAFIQINRKALQKICKKIDKKAKLNGLFRYWYNNVAKKKYGFLTNKMPFSYVQTLIREKNETCPICLEEDYDNFIILDCGHIICMDCLHHLTKNVLKEGKGTPHNLLHHYQYHHKSACPVCRHDKPFDDFMICSK